MHTHLTWFGTFSQEKTREREGRMETKRDTKKVVLGGKGRWHNDVHSTSQIKTMDLRLII
jgi:hypothetical protein